MNGHIKAHRPLQRLHQNHDAITGPAEEHQGEAVSQLRFGLHANAGQRPFAKTRATVYARFL